MPHCVQALDVFAWHLYFSQYQTFTALAWPVAATFCSKRTAPSLSLRLYVHLAQVGNWHVWHRVLDALFTFSLLHSTHILSEHFAQYRIFMALAWPVAATFCSKRTAPSLTLRWCLHTAQEGNWQSVHRVLQGLKALISFSALHYVHVFLASDLHCVHTYVSCLTLRLLSTGENVARGFMVLHVAHFWWGHAMQ